MLKTSGFLVLSIIISLAAADNGYPRCNCDEEGFWSIDNIMECQKVSDFLIAVAYFSIPVELLYFVSCSSVPFKWVLFQFIAFIVLCGMTHLLNGWTYGPHPFQLMLALTIFKFLTALVSFATSITLITLIPSLLKSKVRELLLKKKTCDLDREVGIIKKQKEASWHVRMLTQEIRKSLDRHTILYSTLIELSKTLDLHNCAIWMPNVGTTEMNLTHESKGRNISNTGISPISTSDPDVRVIKGSDGVKILNPESPLALASSGGTVDSGAVAAIRMPMLKVSNFKGGSTPEMIPACYAILVLVLPDDQDRSWNDEELEIVEVVADQVAVALSHASVLEESQLMREKLVEQNRALQQAKQDALMASQARNVFHMVMSNGLRSPMHSILGLISLLQDENFSDEQRLLIDTMFKTSSVLSTLITDVVDTSVKDNGRFPLQMRYFPLHSMIKEAACLFKCLCVYRGYNFTIDVDKSLPNYIMGDERRVFQVILHMGGNLLKGSKGGGSLMLRVYSTGGSQRWNERKWGPWRSNSSDGHVHIRLDVGIRHIDSPSKDILPVILFGLDRYNGGVEEGMSFSACRKLVQLMQGDIWMISNPDSFDQGMALGLRFQVRPSIATAMLEHSESSDQMHSNTLFRGLKVLLADGDHANRAVTRKLLEKLGCIVSAVSSGYDCLGSLGHAVSSCQIVLLDLNLPDLDGFEVTMRIRKFRSRSWPLIVALTASDDGETRERCLQIGMNGVIHKPGSFHEIGNELKHILMQAKANRNTS